MMAAVSVGPETDLPAKTDGGLMNAYSPITKKKNAIACPSNQAKQANETANKKATREGGKYTRMKHGGATESLKDDERRTDLGYFIDGLQIVVT